jgi:adenylylsulfate kinase
MQSSNDIRPLASYISLASLNKWRIYSLIFGLESLIFLLDNLSSSNIPLFLYYIFPVALSSWILDRKISYLLIIFSSCASEFVLSGEFSGNTFALIFINFFQIFTAFFLVDFLVRHVHQLIGSNVSGIRRMNIETKQISLAPPYVVRQPLAVTRKRHEKMNGHRGAIVWLTGLPGSGKSTIACAVEEKLHLSGFNTVVLDGDNIRHGLCADLGFSVEDRNENIRRVGELAKLYIEQGMVVIVALVSPIRSAREKIRQSFPAEDFLEIYCRCPLSVCEERDPKGMYALARDGRILNFTGVSSSYEEPLNPAQILNTGKESIEKSVDRLAQLLMGKLR